MMKLVLVSLSLFIIIGAVPAAMGAKILVTVTMPMAGSHAKALSAIAGALQRRGHDITILTSNFVGTKGFQKDEYSRSVQYNYELPPDLMLPTEEPEKYFSDLAFEADLKQKLKVFGIIFHLMRSGCVSLFEDSATLAKLKEADFDILIGDAFDGCEAMLSSYLGIPHIAVTTGTKYPLFHEHTFGIPAPSSYVPFDLFPFTDKMSFLERVASFFEHHFIGKLFAWPHFSALNKVKDKHGIAPGKSIPELQAAAKLWFGMTSSAFNFPRPTVPNYVGLGGLTDAPAKNLPKRVIWRYTGPRPRSLGNNTMLVDWMPQNDLLGHPKARLLIYHGGLAGVYEAINHAVPMVIMPIFAEQPNNGARVKAKGMGTLLEKDSITYETVKEAVVDVLENPRKKRKEKPAVLRYLCAHLDYADFVDGSGDHGFIVFSLGTHFSELPKPGMAEAFARVFSELPQRVIWRYTGPRPRYLGNNTMLVKWMPQNDLLGHPKARLLIYHGGLAGVYEAINHAVPMVIMPIFAEQPNNGARVKAKGMGTLLEKDSITYETVKEAVVDVLENPSCLENVKRYSAIYKDRQSEPEETVVFWVEHILKFGGSHLRTRALELSFIQLHSIDVLAFILGIALVIVLLLYSCCKRCFQCCLKSKKTKVE
eukprot:XP_011671827.1 PREDICTED: UDP-glucuronosyltransferase 2A1 [Strongylocentrotus purpuratus]